MRCPRRGLSRRSAVVAQPDLDHRESGDYCRPVPHRSDHRESGDCCSPVLVSDIMVVSLLIVLVATAQAFSSAPSKVTRPPCTRRARMQFALYSNQDNVDQAAKGMDEAFTKLDSLSSKDFGDDGDDGEASVDLKYSRTEETQAGRTGKSTAEEIENYLEMQGELEGTAPSEEDLQMKQEELSEETVDDVLSQLDILMEQIGFTGEDEPFESINPILRLRGPVATGYGRGGKKLGVPTANVSTSALHFVGGSAKTFELRSCRLHCFSRPLNK